MWHLGIVHFARGGLVFIRLFVLPCIVVVLQLLFVGVETTYAAPLEIMDFEEPPKVNLKIYPKEAEMIPLEDDNRPNQEWLQMRNPKSGILFCSGQKGQEIIECKNSKSGRVRSDLYRIALSGWKLKQVVSDDRSGLWYFFFQQ